jgi:hypothetical protein
MAYLLPCPQCERKLAVTTGQAGDRLRCECGAEVEVPTVRSLRALPEVHGAVGPKRSWSTRHSVVFLGAVVAIAGLAFGVYLHVRSVAERPRDNFAEDIQGMSPDKAWELWSSIMRHGATWKPQKGVAQEKAIKRYDELVRWKWIGFGIAGAGAIIAIIGLAMFAQRAAGPPKRPPRRPAATAGRR